MAQGETTPRTETLSNGMSLINIPVPGSEMGAVYLIVRAGSRNETPETAGLAHFLEHLFFKGTQQRPSAEQIARDFAIDGISTNAYTAQEEVCYYASGRAIYLDKMAANLAEMLTSAVIDPAEVERERNVVVQELSTRSQSPTSWLSDHLGEVTFGGTQAVSRPVGGSPAVIRSVTRDEIAGYRGQLYAPDQMALVVCGGQGITKERAEQLLGSMPQPTLSRPREKAVWGKGADWMFRKFSPGRGDEPQVHLRLALPGIPANDPREPAMEVLTTILGGDMWSRLFISVRERAGLAYYASAGHRSFDDAGIFIIGMATLPKDAAKATEMAVAELKKMALDGPTAEEMLMAKACLSTAVSQELETAENRGLATAQEWRRGATLKTPAELAAEFDTVTPEQVKAMAQQLVLELPALKVGVAGAQDVGRAVLAAAGKTHVIAPKNVTNRGAEGASL